MADRRLVEVNAIGEAQGAVVAYVPEGGDRFNGAQGVGGAYRGYQGRQEQRGGYPSQQWGGYQGGSKGGTKGGKAKGGKGKGKMVRTGQVPGSKDGLFPLLERGRADMQGSLEGGVWSLLGGHRCRDDVEGWRAVARGQAPRGASGRTNTGSGQAGT